MARPLKEIDWNDFDKLCAIQCTGEEIAAFFEVDYDTLNAICKREKGRGFSDYFAQKRQLEKSLSEGVNFKRLRRAIAP